MQQINLYLPEFQPKREPLTAIHMLWIMAAFIILLFVASYFLQQKNSAMEQQVNLQTAKNSSLQQQLDSLTRSIPQTDVAVLDAEIMRLQQDLLRRKRLITLVMNSNLGNSQGFSEQLRAMSRQALDTIALDAFSLSRGGRYVEFIGKTTASEQVPIYVQQLRKEDSFNAVAFGVLHLELDEKNKSVYRFSLAQQTDSLTPADEHLSGVQAILNPKSNSTGRAQ